VDEALLPQIAENASIFEAKLQWVYEALLPQIAENASNK